MLSRLTCKPKSIPAKSISAGYGRLVKGQPGPETGGSTRQSLTGPQAKGGPKGLQNI